MKNFQDLPFDTGSHNMRMVKDGQYFPLGILGDTPKLAAQEWPLLVNGEVRFTRETSRSNGHFRGIMEFCY